MRHLKSTLATLTTALTVLGAAACGSTPGAGANSPSGSRIPPVFSKYGSPMGEAAGYSAGPSTEATPGSVGKPPPPKPIPVDMAATAPSPDEPVAALGAINAPTTAALGSTSGASVATVTVTPAAPVTWGAGPDVTPVGVTGVTNQMGGMVDMSTLNDAQFAAVVQAINDGEIKEAQLAMSKAAAPDVKVFARDMAMAHAAMQTKMNALLGRLQITPSDNAESNQLKSDTQSELASLQPLRGKEFDREYIDAQVRNHNAALELIDHMTPNVKNADLKMALNSVRPKVEAHLREAERVQLTLQKGSANPQPVSP